MYWLNSMEPNHKLGQERAIRLGAELSLQLSESDQDDRRKTLVTKLAEKFPDNPTVLEELEKIRELEEN